MSANSNFNSGVDNSAGETPIPESGHRLELVYRLSKKGIIDLGGAFFVSKVDWF